jgi:hypothetical protein
MMGVTYTDRSTSAVEDRGGKKLQLGLFNTHMHASFILVAESSVSPVQTHRA